MTIAGSLSIKRESGPRNVLSSNKVFLEQEIYLVPVEHIFFNLHAKGLAIGLSNVVWLLLSLMWWLLKEPFVCKEVWHFTS